MADGVPVPALDEPPEREIELLDAPLDSPALNRLIEEVRGEEEVGVSRSYNRTYNRHNR